MTVRPEKKKQGDQAKDSEAKNVETKDAEAVEAKDAEAKDAEAKDAEAKGVETKDAEDSEAKDAEAKDAEAKGAEAKGAEAKDAEAAEAKPGVDDADSQEPEEPAEPDANEAVTEALLPRVQMGRTDWRHTAGVLFICVAIFVPVMGSYGMFDPWETHYTEVARQFMVRDNWLETYWHNGRGPEGFAETNFWSKPVGSFWMSGLSLKLFGYSAKTTGEEIATGHIEWAVRVPFFLCALFGIFCIYLMCARLFNRRTGVLAAVITATAPMYFMIGRQAMTDMPYVGLMSGGLALFMLAVFGHKEEMRRKEIKLWRWRISWPHCAAYYLFLAAFIGFMALQLNAIMGGLRRVPLPIKLFGAPLSMAVVMLIYVVLAAVVVWLSRKTKTKNEVYLYTFYMVVGIAGLAKGLIGALQPGMVILVYLLTSREWRMLADVALGRGLLVAACIFVPWYHGMVARFGRSFWNEFFGTEQLRRLTIGEQAQARGTFEYYISQIGYGLFPWIAFLPAALVRAFDQRSDERSPRDRVRLFALVWLAAAMALFTLTITKYHHYILPAIPPAAILVALYLNDLLEERARGVWVGALCAVGVLALVAFDLVKQPARWVWMYTYLYDNNWARGIPEETPGKILIYSLAFGAVLLLLFVPKLRKTAVWLTAAVAIVGGGYVLNWYQLGVAPNWSQKGAISSYYKLRKGPEEELVAWQFNWRGETWYTGAEVVVSKSLDNKAIQKYLSQRLGRKFFFITERSRFPSLRNMLPSQKGRKTLKIVDDNNVHYVLAAAEL